MTLAFFMVHVLHSFKSFDVELSSEGLDPLVDLPFAFSTTFDDIVVLGDLILDASAMVVFRYMKALM